jgi:hypothetical protein
LEQHSAIRGQFNASYARLNSKAIIDKMEQDTYTLYPTHDTVAEVFYYLFRILAAIFAIILIFFLFYHD